MRFFNFSSYSLAFASILLGLSVAEPSVAQTRRDSPSSVINILSEVASPDQRYIQGYACFSSPTAERIPTTYAVVEQGDTDPQYIPIIRWTSTTFSDSGFTPQKRCEIVSERLDQHLKQGILEYIVQGQLSEQNVLFAASELMASTADSFSLEPVQPDNDNLIITLEPNESPESFLGSFVDVLKARRGPITRGVRWIRVDKEVTADVLTETPFELQEDSLVSP